jgi:RiboL-PSP-HEPN
MAKPLFTFSSLSSKLDDEFAWRRKELNIIKNKIPNLNNPLQSAMLRAALPLLYAHWEGFVKISMSYYLEYVSRKYLKHNELTPNFIALSLQNKLGELNTGDFDTRIRIVEYLISNSASQSNIPKKNIINTKSNLKFYVLKEILLILHLDDPHIDKYEELIDDLVDTRNHIAHGQYLTIDYTTFINMHDDVIALMEHLKTSIENNASLEKYKITASTGALPITPPVSTPISVK